MKDSHPGTDGSVVCSGQYRPTSLATPPKGLVKPPQFSYARPTKIDDALKILDDFQGGARVLAGGQSLLPLLNFRLAGPEVLVDISAVDSLDVFEASDTGVRIGANVTQRAAETSSDLARYLPVLPQALRHVGHVQNRNRGTVAGSMAHADPAAELPAVAVAFDAEMVTASSLGSRVIAAQGFFLGPYGTALEPGEILAEVRFPAWAGV